MNIFIQERHKEPLSTEAVRVLERLIKLGKRDGMFLMSTENFLQQIVRHKRVHKEMGRFSVKQIIQIVPTSLYYTIMYVNVRFLTHHKGVQ